MLLLTADTVYQLSTFRGLMARLIMVRFTVTMSHSIHMFRLTLGLTLESISVSDIFGHMTHMYDI